MAGRTKLLIGASGFLDSHVTRQLVERHYGDVFYCVVDTRAWLRDPAALSRTNVEELQHVLRAAADAELHRFGYIRSRVAAERLVLQCATDRGLPAVALCAANTYGPGDYSPTPHGAGAVLGSSGGGWRSTATVTELVTALLRDDALAVETLGVTAEHEVIDPAVSTRGRLPIGLRVPAIVTTPGFRPRWERSPSRAPDRLAADGRRTAAN